MNEIYNYRTVGKIIYFDSVLKINKHIIESISDDNNSNNCDIYVCKKEKIDWSKIDKQYHRQIFTENEFSVNILDNVMVPHHSKCDTFGSEYKEIPIMKTYDIIARKMNFCINDIIKIDRKDGSVYYRRIF